MLNKESTHYIWLIGVNLWKLNKCMFLVRWLEYDLDLN